MARRLILALVAIATLLAPWVMAPHQVEAAVSDVWQVLANISGRRLLVWRVPGATGQLLPGADNSYAIGSSSYRPSALYVVDTRTQQLHLDSVAVTTNTTLTVANGTQIRIGTLSANITLTLDTPAHYGDGAVLDIQDIAGTLDATHTVTITPGSGTINGVSTLALATAYGGKRIITNGTNFFAR